jgi:hypothetical protein
MCDDDDEKQESDVPTARDCEDFSMAGWLFGFFDFDDSEAD